MLRSASDEHSKLYHSLQGRRGAQSFQESRYYPFWRRGRRRPVAPLHPLKAADPWFADAFSRVIRDEAASNADQGGTVVGPASWPPHPSMGGRALPRTAPNFTTDSIAVGTFPPAPGRLVKRRIPNLLAKEGAPSGFKRSQGVLGPERGGVVLRSAKVCRCPGEKPKCLASWSGSAWGSDLEWESEKGTASAKASGSAMDSGWE